MDGVSGISEYGLCTWKGVLGSLILGAITGLVVSLIADKFGTTLLKLWY